MTKSNDNRRIIKNTIFLYFRMILTTVVSFFTVRIVLKNLGVEDYGINNVISSIITMFGFISNSMGSSTQRFFAYELGENGSVFEFRKIFSINVIIYTSFGLIIFLLSETIGLWFLNNKLNIPADRINAANWIFHFYNISFVLSMITIPYNSAIIAYEKMNAFAYVSIIDVILKMLIAYALIFSPIDKLVFYVFLALIQRFVITLIYRNYSSRKLPGCKFRFYWNKEMFKTQFSFAGWNFFGSISYVLNNQGQNVLLNLFFGPMINAAKGIADKISSIIYSFSSNFYVAVIPQLIKSYADGNLNYMISLSYKSSKFSFFLLYILALPVIILIRDVLKLWLDIITEPMVTFTQLTLIYMLISVLEQPLSQMIKATGNIKWYQIVIGCFTLLLIPISYLLLKLGFPAETTMIVMIVIVVLVHPLRLVFVSKQVGASKLLYLKIVILPIFYVVLASALIPVLTYNLLNPGLFRMFFVVTISLFSSLISIFIFGLEKQERQLVALQVRKLTDKLKI